MAEVRLQVSELCKAYGDFIAVDDVSFEVFAGEVFGLLGPNGAGKTTTIRIVMDIFSPDHGSVLVLGHPPGKMRERVGYLPEERGLYRDLKVLDTLVYLGELKGMRRSDARASGQRWLERLELAEWSDHKVKDLSRGMQQKLQIAAALVHDPDLVVLDEPFQGLDPLNVQLVKEIIRELQQAGKAVLLSAHQMNLVEVLCDRILLINWGRAVLYGPLQEIKARYGARQVRVRARTVPEDLPGVAHMERHDHTWTLTLEQISPEDLLRELLHRHVSIEAFEIASMPLEEIFLNAVRGEQHVA
ncbi:MAG: ATP-binding cassette domain-containing protein [Anaerolineae bacterium]